jgi:hypothetical protein
MNWTRIALSFVLVDFSALTAWAVAEHGPAGVLALALANTVTVTLFVDLAIALGLVAVWMWQDARDRGVTPLPYVVLTLTLGSVGPLLYLVRHWAGGAPARV